MDDFTEAEQSYIDTVTSIYAKENADDSDVEIVALGHKICHWSNSKDEMYAIQQVVDLKHFTSFDAGFLWGVASVGLCSGSE